MNRRFLGFFLWSFLGVTRTVQAQPQSYAATSESLTQEGLGLRRDGRDAEALAVFERALAIDSSPRTLAQVALAEEALGLWAEAERTLQRAMAIGTDPWFAKHADTLRTALDAIAMHLATLRVDSNVPGAELWLNGARVGVVPLATPLRVAAGPITMEVRAQGFDPVARSLTILPQTELHETVALAKQVSPVGEAPAADARAGCPGSLPEAHVVAATESHDADAGVGSRTGAWVSLGAAVLLAAGSGVAVLFRNTNAADYNDDARCYFGTLTRDQRCGSYRDAASIAQTVAIVGAGAAAAAAIASTVLFVRASGERTTRIGIEGCWMGVGVVCKGAF